MDRSSVASQPESWPRRATRNGCVVLLVAMLASMLGCSSVAVFLGLRIRLDKLPVTAVSASLANARGGSAINALAPGQSAQLVIVATTQDGKQYPTVGIGKGKVAFDNYTLIGGSEGQRRESGARAYRAHGSS
jgi:hypothetical protein